MAKIICWKVNQLGSEINWPFNGNSCNRLSWRAIFYQVVLDRNRTQKNKFHIFSIAEAFGAVLTVCTNSEPGDQRCDATLR